MKAMILTAGLGKRLGSITDAIPKALVDINGKTALQRAVDNCSAYGFNEIIINVHHFADKIEEEVGRLNNLGYNISVSDEREKILETGGGLYEARHFFDDSPFLIYNVDIVTDLDLSALYKFHIKKRGLATLAVRERPGKRFFLVDKSGRIHGWCNKGSGEKILSGDISEELSETAFSGIHIVEPDIFNYMKRGIYSLTELYLDLAADHKIFTYRNDDGYWFDIGTPENLENIRGFLERNK